MEDKLLGTPKYLQHANVLSPADSKDNEQVTQPEVADHVHYRNINEYSRFNTSNNTGYQEQQLNDNNLTAKLSIEALRNPFNLECNTIRNPLDNPRDNPATVYHISSDSMSITYKRYEDVEMAEDIPTETQEELITPGYINQMFNATSLIPLMTVEKMIQNEPIDLFDEEVDTSGESKGSVPLCDFWDEK